MLTAIRTGTEYDGSGAFDREVTIQQLSEAVGTDGGTTPTWTTLATVWARKQDVRGGERFSAHQLSAPFDTVWTLHYREDCDPETVDVPKLRRLVFQSRTYDVVFARHLGRRGALEMTTLSKGAVS